MSQSRVREYLESLVRYNSDICETIRERALEDEVPIIRRDTESFLKTVLAMKRPKNDFGSRDSGWLFCHCDGRILQGTNYND